MLVCYDPARLLALVAEWLSEQHKRWRERGFAALPPGISLLALKLERGSERVALAKTPRVPPAPVRASERTNVPGGRTSSPSSSSSSERASDTS